MPCVEIKNRQASDSFSRNRQTSVSLDNSDGIYFLIWKLQNPAFDWYIFTDYFILSTQLIEFCLSYADYFFFAT